MTLSIVGDGERRAGRTGCRLNGTRIENFDTYHYLVYSTETTGVDRDAVKLTAGLPRVGISMLPNGSTCTSVEAKRNEKNVHYWDVDCEFSTESSDQSPGQNPSDDPTTWIPTWKIDYENVDFIGTTDRNGTQLVNSAGERFDEGIVWTLPVSAWTFSQYEIDSLTEDDVAGRSNIMNQVAFNGFERDTLLLVVTGSERTIVNGFPVRRIDYKVKYFRGFAESGQYKYFDSQSGTWTDATWPSGWQELRVDAGNYYIDTAKRKTYFTDDGHRIVGNLKGDGTRAAYNEKPAILAFDKYKEEDFSNIIRIS